MRQLTANEVLHLFAAELQGGYASDVQPLFDKYADVAAVASSCLALADEEADEECAVDDVQRGGEKQDVRVNGATD